MWKQLYLLCTLSVGPVVFAERASTVMGSVASSSSKDYALSDPVSISKMSTRIADRSKAAIYGMMIG